MSDSVDSQKASLFSYLHPSAPVELMVVVGWSFVYQHWVAMTTIFAILGPNQRRDAIPIELLVSKVFYPAF